MKLIQNDNFEDLNQKVIDIIDKFGLSQSYIKGYDHYNVDSSSGLGQYNKDAFLNLRSEFNKEKQELIYCWCLFCILSITKLDLIQMAILIYQLENGIIMVVRGEMLRLSAKYQTRKNSI